MTSSTFRLQLDTTEKYKQKLFLSIIFFYLNVHFSNFLSSLLLLCSFILKRFRHLSRRIELLGPDDAEQTCYELLRKQMLVNENQNRLNRIIKNYKLIFLAVRYPIWFFCHHLTRGLFHGVFFD